MAIVRFLIRTTKIIFWGLFLMIISCNTSPRDNSSGGDTKKDKVADQPEGPDADDRLGAIWTYSFNPQKEIYEIIQMRPVDKDTLTGKILETIINNSWPKVRIEFMGTSNDTAYLSIPDSEALTQQMGSAGAESFMITTTWTFTELKAIRYVAFDFTYGDHAMPGVYSRSSWEKNFNR